MTMRLGSDTASVNNWMMAGSKQPIPELGMGATILMWTDRHAATVVKISASGKTITLREDKATRSDGNGMSDQQSYNYEADPNGRELVARLGKKGWNVSRLGAGLLLGTRSAYHDYSF